MWYKKGRGDFYNFMRPLKKIFKKVMHILFQLKYGVRWLYIAGVHHIRISHETPLSILIFVLHTAIEKPWNTNTCKLAFCWYVQYKIKMLFLWLYVQKHFVQYAHFASHRKKELTLLPLHHMLSLFPINWAAIQRRGSILAWIVTLSVYGAGTIAEVKLLISPFLRWSLDLWN